MTCNHPRKDSNQEKASYTLSNPWLIPLKWPDVDFGRRGVALTTIMISCLYLQRSSYPQDTSKTGWPGNLSTDFAQRWVAVKSTWESGDTLEMRMWTATAAYHNPCNTFFSAPISRNSAAKMIWWLQTRRLCNVPSSGQIYKWPSIRCYHPSFSLATWVGPGSPMLELLWIMYRLGMSLKLSVNGAARGSQAPPGWSWEPWWVVLPNLLYVFNYYYFFVIA